MKRNLLSLCLAASAFGLAFTSAPALAQQMGGYGNYPHYNSWQHGWDQGRYDRRHVILGRVISFSPYRLTIARRNGNDQTVDLKGGTVIRPLGATPHHGERIAMIGYWSNGTFIVNRLIIR